MSPTSSPCYLIQTAARDSGKQKLNFDCHKVCLTSFSVSFLSCSFFHEKFNIKWQLKFGHARDNTVTGLYFAHSILSLVVPFFLSVFVLYIQKMYQLESVKNFNVY